MATSDSRPEETAPRPNALNGFPPRDMTPHFQPFRWYGSAVDKAQRLGAHDHQAALRFAGNARDVISGMGLVLQLLEQESSDDAGGEQPLLPGHALGELQRLAIAAGDMLVRSSDGHMDRLEASVNAMQAAAEQRNATPEPIALLHRLDDWMAHAGHGDEHPWRASIARTLAAHAQGAAHV